MWGNVNLLAPILALFYLHRNLSWTEQLFVLLTFSVSILIFEVPTGAFADRFGPKTSFYAGSLVRFISLACLLFSKDHIWLIYLSQVLSGLSATFFSGADEALIYESLKRDDREEEMGTEIGKIYSARMVSTIVGAIIGAWIGKDLTEWQFDLLILLQKVCVLIQLGFLTKVIEPPAFEHNRDHPWKHVHRGWKEIRQAPYLLLLFVHVTVIFIPTYIFDHFKTPWYQKLSLPVAWIGIIVAIANFLSFLASQHLGRIVSKGREVTWMYLTGGIILIGYLLLVLFPNIWIAIFVSLLIPLANAIRNPLYSQLSNEYISTGSRATALSLLSVLDSLFDVLIVIPMGFVASSFSVSGTGLMAIFLGCAAFTLIGLCFPVRRNKESG